jgi:hypothetical protein
MAAIQTFLDESGSERVFVIAAYLATTEKWTAFEKRWAEILRSAKHFEAANDEARLLPFHMTDYENRQPPYDSWPNDKRVQVICDLIDAINDSVDSALICRMPLALFEAAIPPTLRGGKKFLYMACFHSIYIGLLGVSKLNSLGRMPLFLDRNREVCGHVLDIDKQTRGLVPEIETYIGSLTFDNKANLIPLQAADILAYEAMKNADNLVLQNGKSRRSFERLNRKRYGYHDHDEKSILELVRVFMSVRGTEEWRTWFEERER